MTSKALEHYATQARIAELEAEVARLKPDAERYQWLRDQFWVEQEAIFRLGLSDNEDSAEYHKQIGAAIDAALAASKGA